MAPDREIILTACRSASIIESRYDSMSVTTALPIPACAGIGLRALHHAHVVRERPAIPWLEVHAENFFVEGGPQLALLDTVRRDYPLSLHGVGLSLGSADPLDAQHLADWRRLIDRCDPGLISEHLAWGAIDGRHLNDLLPLPYTEESLRHVIDRVREVQQRLERRIAIENLSSYLRFDESTLDEAEFLAALVAESGCALLLDVNNLYVNACNHGDDPQQYLRRLPASAVAEIHLAGHSVETHGGHTLRVDTHGSRVCDQVWALYREALALTGPVPTLIEWDTDIPAVEVLLQEAARADIILRDVHGITA
jgi:uncharacterized protein (UPF0276 family)